MHEGSLNSPASAGQYGSTMLGLVSNQNLIWGVGRFLGHLGFVDGKPTISGCPHRRSAIGMADGGSGHLRADQLCDEHPVRQMADASGLRSICRLLYGLPPADGLAFWCRVG